MTCRCGDSDCDKCGTPNLDALRVGETKIVDPPKAPITTAYDVKCVVAALEELEALKGTYRRLLHCGKSPELHTSTTLHTHHEVKLPDWVVTPIREMIAARISQIDQELINKWGLVNHITYGWS